MGATLRELLATDAVLHIEAVSPTQVRGTVGDRIDPVPIVVVRNEQGQAAAGAKVVFIPLNRSGAANADFPTNPNVITNSRGPAAPGAWKLGTCVGGRFAKTGVDNWRFLKRGETAPPRLPQAVWES